MPTGPMESEGAIFEAGQSPSAHSFQDLLLKFSALVSEGRSAIDLVESFCRIARDFFQVDGVYFWQSGSTDELIGSVANGLMAEGFSGLRLRADESAVTMEAVRSRKTTFVNRVDISRHATAAEFNARSLMSAPLVVANEVIGAVTFLHSSNPSFFTQDMADKASILAGQLSSLLEAKRLSDVSEQEHRRAEILSGVAQALHSIPEAGAAVQKLAERLRSSLEVPLVCVLMRQAGPAFELQAVSAESSNLESEARTRHDRKGLQFAADLARRAVSAGKMISIAIDPSTHALGNLVEAGTLVAAPFQTSSSDGALLAYPRRGTAFTTDEKSLISTIASFGAVAIANAELHATSREQAQELQQLLAISSELGSIGDLDLFLQKFALRAAEFLGFGRAFIALWEDGEFRVRWGAQAGQSERVELIFPESLASKALLDKQVFWSDDPSKLPGANVEVIAQFQVRQILAVPLLGSEAQVIGMFGVLDRTDRLGISQEHIRRARSLAAQVAVVLEVTRNLHLSKQHRNRAESLTRLAIGLNSLLRLPDFASGFVNRAMEIVGSESSAFAVFQDDSLSVIALHGKGAEMERQVAMRRRLGESLTACLSAYPEPIVTLPAKELLGTGLAADLGWNICTLVKLMSASGELAGLLCLADGQIPASNDDQRLLLALAGHGSVALENARLFTRMEQANRHWTEIFDSITDFIMVHDESDRVMRVNRSLADFIGSQPSELIGLSTWALLEMGSASAPRSCPFCLITSRGVDEYAHPVLDRNYLVSTSRIHGANSEGLQTTHVLKDITDRREAERRYREIFDNIQEGLFFSTPDGRFIEVNDALVRMLGFANREELLHADIKTQVYPSAERHLELVTQMQQHGVLRNHEETLRRRDGSVVHVMINAFAVRDAQDRILQYRGLMLDISGLKNFQAELQRERDFSGKILNNTQSLILVADVFGVINYANRRWYDLGFQQKEVLGRPMEELFAPARRSLLKDALAATAAGRQVDNVDLQIQYSDGRVGQFSVNLSPMRDEQGNVSSIVGVMSDITDAATLQAKLMHTEKMAAVGQLVSGVAHEVNNPLTAILGFSDLLMENPDIPDSARKDLRVILQEAQRTKQIVQNLLSFARQMPPQRQPVQLNPILRRTVQLRSYDLHSRGVEVVERLAQDLPYVVGDSHQLQQVFLNIINNAYDAVRDIKRPGRIEVSSVRTDESVEILFSDNGSGVTHADRIFDPFFTTKEVGQGTGLGLSICYGIVREHGGEISCRNNPDGGATFVVRLPAMTDASHVAAAAGADQ
jgi:PAS domain S-box-containing protein